MAVATYTSTVFNNMPKFVHAGDNTVSGQLTWGATSTVGDVGFLCKIPHGAKIIDFAEYHTTGATTQNLKFGFDRGIAAGGGGNRSILLATTAQAVFNRISTTAGLGLFSGPNNAPLTISVSDTDTLRYAILCAQVVSGTTTTSLFVNFIISYRVDGPDTV